MNEKELIAKIRELRQIKPREDWVLFTKKELFKEESKKGTEFLLKLKRNSVPFLSDFFSSAFQIAFHHKPAFAFLVVLLVLIGVFGFAQNSIPGDSLFSLRKIGEKSQGIFVSPKDQVKANLGLVSKRLDDLEKIVETNSMKNLASALTEYQESVSKAVQGLAKAEPKEIIEEVKKLEEKTERIKSYGIEIEESQEFENALAKIVEREIENLANRDLDKEQAGLLEEIKEAYEVGQYSQALEKILIISNNE